MCSSFIVNGTRCENIEELINVVNVDISLFVVDCYGNFNPLKNKDTCLCPIDYMKLSKKINQRVASDGFDIYFGEDADKVEQKYPGKVWDIKG